MNKRELSDTGDDTTDAKRLRQAPCASINPEYMQDEYKTKLGTSWRYSVTRIWCVPDTTVLR